MSKLSNAQILAELWEDGKVFAFNAKEGLLEIKAAEKKKSGKMKAGQVKLQLPESFIGETLQDAYGGKDIWLMFCIKPEDWDRKLQEIKERSN